MECRYNVSEEGISKLRDVRQKLQYQSGMLDVLHVVVETLRHASDEVATEILARLRLGQSFDEILRRLQELRSMQCKANGAMAWHDEGWPTQQRPVQPTLTCRDQQYASSGVYYQSMSSSSNASGFVTSSHHQSSAFDGPIGHGFSFRPLISLEFQDSCRPHPIRAGGRI